MKKILIIAGEASGDMHGASLVSAILKKSPDIEFFGLGGKKMEAAGVRLYYNLVEIAVLGFSEVLKKIFVFRRIFLDTVKNLDREKFDCVILIDYPGFNLKFAKEVKKRNIPLIYYISPQVWAWGAERIELMRKLVDKIIVFFKFEEALYKKSGINAEFVGHPLLDTARPSATREELQRAFGLKRDKKTIALLPGSRRFEVENILPVMKNAAELIKKEYPDVQFLITRVPSLKEDIFSRILKDKDTGMDMRIIENKTYDVLEASDLALVKSGTSTVECAILERPMLIIYKASFLTYILTRVVIKLPYIGMVNVIAGRKIVPEFLQYEARPRLIATEAIALLKDNSKTDEMRRDLRKVKEKLGPSGANERAAQAVLNFIYRTA